MIDHTSHWHVRMGVGESLTEVVPWCRHMLPWCGGSGSSSITAMSPGSKQLWSNRTGKVQSWWHGDWHETMEKKGPLYKMVYFFETLTFPTWRYLENVWTCLNSNCELGPRWCLYIVQFCPTCSSSSIFLEFSVFLSTFTDPKHHLKSQCGEEATATKNRRTQKEMWLWVKTCQNLGALVP